MRIETCWLVRQLEAEQGVDEKREKQYRRMKADKQADRYGRQVCRAE